MTNLQPPPRAVRRRTCSPGAGLALATVLAGGACAGQPPTAPSPPRSFNGSPFRPSAGTTLGISGMVWLHGPAGRELAPAGSIFGWVEAEGRGSTTGAVPIDAGRYDFRVPQGTTRVSVSRGRNGFQPCAVTLTPTADVTADLHVVTDARWRGAHLPAELLAQSPTLSGVVYEATPEGRRAVRDAWVWLDGVYGLGQLVADTRTDDEGRYILCAVPALSSLVLQVSANGFQLFESSGNLPGRDTLDVELRRNGASPAR